MSASTKRTKRTGDKAPDAALVRRAGPWAGSALAHLAIIGIVILLTWNLTGTRVEKTTPVVTAEIPNTTADAIPRLASAEEPENSIDELPIEIRSLESLAAPGSLAMPGRSGALTAGIGRGAPMSLGRVEFAGLGAAAARRVVFVVDASGSMIGVFPFVVDELARSLENLSPSQSYAVIFFQRDEALPAPPRGRLTTATSEHVASTLRWIRGEPNAPPTVVPTGRSNPLRALADALELDPEVIFLLSSNVTGSGRYAVDLELLLAELDALNPPDAASGRRRTNINCIQFLDPDPLDALRTIAEEHGGSEGYRFLGRTELGLNPLGTP
jgi:hypothetical protein